MLTVLSPAKRLDYDSALATKKFTLPSMQEEARELVSIMRAKTPDEIADLMDLSPDLARLNWDRFQDWDEEFTRANARQAVLAFRGDVYQGMQPETFSQRDFTYAQRHLRILSGLHGLLRPLDLVQPYRLEMGAKVPNSRGADLYGFWRDQITDALNKELATRSPKVLINLASKEYFRAVDERSLEARVVTPTFLDFSRGEYRVVGFFAKRARGVMASWLLKARIKSVKKMRDFDGLGYRYLPEHSTQHHPAFAREPQA